MATKSAACFRGDGQSAISSEPLRRRTKRAENLRLMNFLDKLHKECPFYGYRKLTWEVPTSGYAVNHKREQRLRKQMYIEVIYFRRRPNIYVFDAA